MIGFNQNGSLTIQTLRSHGIDTYAVFSESWTHVCMIYSLPHGIRLFVNGSLLNSNTTFTDYSASGKICTITVGTCLQPNACAVDQTKIVPSQFHGRIDELKIFSREPSTNDVIQLMSSSLNR
jgi:hypothetical protein